MGLFCFWALTVLGAGTQLGCTAALLCTTILVVTDTGQYGAQEYWMLQEGGTAAGEAREGLAVSSAVSSAARRSCKEGLGAQLFVAAATTELGQLELIGAGYGAGACRRKRGAVAKAC